ncbi:hypothetical protein [Lentzea terrae]|uniref:hypothetical protein n=1 Tax=Lentzea terrae TaxID=2200761 RepID=UPI000DD3140E|nr:hypothetical protein [Lentzea terrae]
MAAPIDFSVADETERDLSPLYVDSDEPWRWGVYFRRAGTWWNLHDDGKVTLKPSTGDIHQPGVGDAIITAPPGEDVLGLTTVGGSLALLTREGDVIRARTEDDVRTVVEVAGPVLRHHELPWIGVQRSPHLVEVIDIATGAVLHDTSTG